MAKLNYIGRNDYLINYTCNSSVEELCEWFNNQKIVQFDTETNVTKSIVDRELRVVQFGSELGDVVFVIQWSFLSEKDKSKVLQLLANDKILKIIHNASFDYQVILKEGIVMNNVWDTMVMEQILYAGHDMDLRFFALAVILQRRYYIDISKEQQSEFGDDIINDEKLIYAATDVVHLGRLRLDQRKELIAEDLIQLAEPGNPYEVDGKIMPAVTENEVVLAFADIEYNGMGFDPEKWRENIAKAEPIVKEAVKDLSTILLEEPYRSMCRKLDVKIKIADPDDPYNTQKKRTFETKALVEEDQFTINWNSGAQALKLLKWIFPDLEGASALALKTYLQNNDGSAPKTDEKGKAISPASKKFAPYIEDIKPDKFSVIKALILKKYNVVEQVFLANFRDRLVDEGYYIPAGEISINWNSHDTKLSIFRWFVPSAETTNAEFVESNIHLPFFQAFQQYQFANSLVTKYGERFIAENVDSDGRVRTRFNIILSTGRVSSSSPNAQNIPAKALPKDRQNDYRSCFIPGYDDWSVVDSDYSSQELALVACFSRDPVFMEALETGKDLHSVAAEKVHKQKWVDAAEPDCAYYAKDDNGEPKKEKCSCPKHGVLRDGIKTINFGLVYGMSAYGLMAKLKITEREAVDLIEEYFEAFPSIKGTLNAFGHYGQCNGFIRTVAPMRRKRYFPYWKGLKDTSDFLLKKIDRAAKNAPFQGTAADMTKIAVVLLRREIDRAKARDKVKLFMQVHDQISTICRNDLVKFWEPVVTKTMELAAEIILHNKLLKAETQTSERWKK
ncbi:DNA polymerase [Tenacibaculum sp.]|uniref:DNA polymerase n=1 Tax=Tenacibaculum sp. TaxID=1906242 RepID=UPI003D152AE9